MPIAGRGAARPVPHPEPRHGQRRPAVRAGHAGSGSRSWACSALAQIVQNPAVLRGARPASTRVGLFAARRLAGLRGAGRHRAGGHRGRGALRRHGPLRPHADPPRLARPRAARRWCSTISARVRWCCAIPRRSSSPFYHLVPDWALLAADRARHAGHHHRLQAVISGVFSLTRQAIQLGYLPRMTIQPHLGHRDRPDLHPARQLAVDGRACCCWCVGFGSSGNLAAAYGISVTGAMAIDAVLAGLVAAWRWGWGPAARAGVRRCLLLIDLAYFAANALKIPSGGWFPLAVAAAFAYYGGHLAPRPARAAGQALRPRACRSRASSTELDPTADPGAGHGGVHDRQPRRRADGAPAQPQAQQGAARARACS